LQRVVLSRKCRDRDFENVVAEKRIKKLWWRNRYKVLQAGNSGDPSPVEIGKRSADKHFVVRLQGDRIHNITGAGAGIKRRIEDPIAAEPGNEIIRHAVDRVEIAAKQDFAISLDRERSDRVVRARRGVKGAIQ